MTQLIVRPNFFANQSIDKIVEPKGSLADILDNSGILFTPGFNLCVTVNNKVVPTELCETYMPAHGDIIKVYSVPQGGDGGKNPLRTILTLAVVALSAGALGFAGLGLLSAEGMFGVGGVLGGLGLGTSAAFMSFASMAFTGAYIYAGLRLINAIAPLPSNAIESTSNRNNSIKTYSISGSSNQATPWAPIPVLLGRHRFSPPYAAKPYTEIIGDDQFVRCLYCLGYGPLMIDPNESIYIGETPLMDYIDSGDSSFEQDRITWKFWSSYNPDTDGDLSIYSQTVHEQQFDILLEQSSGFYTQVTESDMCDEVIVDIIAPNGLALINENDGSKTGISVQTEIQIREYPNGNWSTGITPVDFTAATVSIAKPTVPGIDFSLWFDYDIPIEPSIYYQYHRIGLDVANNTLYTVHGELTTVNNATAKQKCPSLPLNVAPICGVYRSSADDDISISDIEDHRGYQLGRVNTTDFAPGPASGGQGVTIAAGQYIYQPVIKGCTTSPIRSSVHFHTATRGKYEVRMRRVSSDTDNQYRLDKIHWACLRSVTHESPINMAGLSLFEMRVKATDKINGALSNFNLTAISCVPSWDSDTETWSVKPTNNPASLLRYVWQGAPNKRPLADARINLTDLQTFHEFCKTNYYCFNHYLTTASSVKEVSQLIASVARSSVTYKDGKYTVITDTTKSSIIQHITPRNSWGFKASKQFLNLPHAFRVTFNDEAKLYNTNECYIYRDGYTSSTATLFEELQFTGITNYNQCWKNGRFHLAQLMLRPEVYEVSMDIENLRCTRGDLIRITHDVPLWGVVSARIKSVTMSGQNAVGVVVDDPLRPEQGEDYAVRIRLSDGSSVYAAINNPYDADDEIKEYTTLTFTTALTGSSIPAAGNLIMMGIAGQESAECLIKSIKPSTNFNATLELVDYNTAIYASDTAELPAFNPNITLPTAPSAPTITSVQSESLNIGVYNIRVSIYHPSTNANQQLTSMEVEYRAQDSVTWFKLPGLSANTTEVIIPGVTYGVTYDIRARYLLTTMPSLWSNITTCEVVGSSITPSNTYFDTVNTAFAADKIVFKITDPEDLSIDFYEIRTNTNWGTLSGLIIQTKSLTYVYANPIDINATYYLKAHSRDGLYSPLADSISGTAITISIANSYTDFTTPDCKTWWTPIDERLLKYYTVFIYTDSGRTQLRRQTTNITTPEFTYTYAMNSADGTPAATLYFTIQATDIYDRTCTSNITGTNAAPSNTITGSSDFNSKDCIIRWSVDTPRDFYRFGLFIYSDSGRTTLVRTVYTHSNSYTYTLEENTADNTSAIRSLYFRLHCYDIYGASNYVDFSASNSAPSAPSTPTLTAIFGGIDISWTHSYGDIIGYNVQFGTSNPPSTGETRFIQGNHCTIDGLPSNTLYYVRIQAVDSFGVGSWSTVASTTTLYLGLTNYNLEIPLLSGFTWTTSGWSSGTLIYKGISYTISADTFTGSNCYVYWDLSSSPTTFHQSATAPSLGTDIWLIAFKDITANQVHVADAHKIIHGGLIQAESIGTNQMAASSITADKLSIGGTAIKASSDLEFLASFDNTLVTNKGDTPSTNTAPILRPDGKFGGCVAIEKAVTNILSGYTDFTSWTAGGEATITLTQDQSDPFGGLEATRIQAGSGSTTTKYGSPQTLTVSGTAYSDQVWVKALIGNVYVDNGFSTQLTITPADGWVHVIQENLAGDGVKYVHITFSAANVADSLDFLAYQPQIQTGSFCSSFVATSKVASHLKYSFDHSKIRKGSLSFWMNLHKTPEAADSSFYVFELPNVGSAYGLMIYKPTGSNVLQLYANATSLLSHNFTTYNWQGHEWHHVAVSWDYDTPEWIFCVDGIVHTASTSVTFPSGTFTDVITVGGYHGSTSYVLNGLIDDLCIFSETRTAEELQAWYYLNGPHIDTNAVNNSEGTVLINSKGIQIYNADLEIVDSLSGSLRFYGKDNATDGRGAGDLIIGDEDGGLDYDFSAKALILKGSIEGKTALGTPAANGLYLGSDYMGYYAGGWKNYIKSDGSFGFIQSEDNVNDDPTAAMLTNSGLDSFSAANLLDDSTASTGFTCDSCAAGSNLIVDLGSGVTRCYGKLRLYMSASFARTFDIAYSDDGSTYTTVKTGWAPKASGWNEISWGNVGFHRYWKVTVQGSAKAGGDIMEMEWYTAGSYIKFDNAAMSMMLKQLVVSSPQGILVSEGGDITLTGNTTNAASIILEGTDNSISIKTNTAGDEMGFAPNVDNVCSIVFGKDPTDTSSDRERFYNITLSSTYRTYSYCIDPSDSDAYSLIQQAIRGINFYITTDALITTTGMRILDGMVRPTTHKATDFGQSTYAWDDCYADDFHNVADFPYFDEIDDLAAIKQIQPLMKDGEYVRDDLTKNVLIDDDTLPEILLHRHKRDFTPSKDKDSDAQGAAYKRGDIARDPDGKPYIPLKAISMLALGAIKQLDNKCDTNFTDLLKRIETLEKEKNK